jgi:hypothetical protein
MLLVAPYNVGHIGTGKNLGVSMSFLRYRTLYIHDKNILDSQILNPDQNRSRFLIVEIQNKSSRF